MTNFAYSARDMTGAVRTGSVMALDREAALQALRQKGLVPLSVKEGRAPKKAAAWFPRFPRSTVALAGSFVVLLIGWGVWQGVMRPPGALKPLPPTPPQPGKTQRVLPKEPAPTSAEPPVVLAAPPAEPPSTLPAIASPKPATPQTPGKKPRRDWSKVDASRIFEVNPIRPEQTNTPPAKPLFEREAEQRLAQYAKAGQAMPPPPTLLPDTIEAQAQAALKETIVVSDEDTDEEYQTKASVALMKEELRKHLAAGGTARDYFEALAERQKEEAELMSDARGLVTGLAAENKIEEAKKTLKELNAALAKRGLPPVNVSPKFRKQMEATP